MSIIQIQTLSKVYNGSGVPVQALKSVNFSVDQGEFVAIIGPSGSGKTTLLNIIGGLDQPTEGDVIVQGQSLSAVSTDQLTEFRLRNIGFVFQAYNLIPVLSAVENVEFIMLLQNRPAEERRQKAVQWLEAVGLGEKLHTRPGQLSGGQQQRVAVARALASNPAYVLADEPTANLDSKSADQLLELMEQLNETEKATFIFSTHDPRVIKRARRVIILEDGMIKSDEKSRN